MFHSLREDCCQYYVRYEFPLGATVPTPGCTGLEICSSKLYTKLKTNLSFDLRKYNTQEIHNLRRKRNIVEKLNFDLTNLSCV